MKLKILVNGRNMFDYFWIFLIDLLFFVMGIFFAQYFYELPKWSYLPILAGLGLLSWILHFRK